MPLNEHDRVEAAGLIGDPAPISLLDASLKSRAVSLAEAPL
jgi:hypothetical protein